MDTNQKERVTTLLVVLGVVLIGAIAAYLLFMSDIFTKNEEATAPVKECGALVAVDGKTEGASPFAPNLKAKLTGKYDINSPVCEWSIDGAFYAKSLPVSGSCLFSEQNLASKGVHTISYKVVDLKDCPQSMKIIVK